MAQDRNGNNHKAAGRPDGGQFDRKAGQGSDDDLDFEAADARLAEAMPDLDADTRRRLVNAVRCGTGEDLGDSEWRNCDLKKRDFADADLSGSRFGGHFNLDDAVFDRADLSGATFDGSDGRACHASFRNADLTDATLRPGSLYGSDFGDATLTGATIRSDCRECSFRGASMRGARGRRYFDQADFRDADLRDADFAGADFKDADFRGADLRGAVFAGADLRRADLRGARLDGAHLEDVDLTGARYSDGDLKAAIRTHTPDSPLTWRRENNMRRTVKLGNTADARRAIEDAVKSGRRIFLRFGLSYRGAGAHAIDAREALESISGRYWYDVREDEGGILIEGFSSNDMF